MRLSNVLALLAIGGIVYWATGGGAMFRVTQPAELPETIVVPNATFTGNEQANPFAQ